MNKKDLLKLLDNVTLDDKKPATFNKHDRVLIIDGLNLFFRNSYESISVCESIVAPAQIAKPNAVLFTRSAIL